MKIKRFYAKTMRAALQEVRDEQGPDSVILSKRRVPDGIEVIAAVDYDEALLHQSSGAHKTTNGTSSNAAAASALSAALETTKPEAVSDPAAFDAGATATFKEALRLADEPPIAVLREPGAVIDPAIPSLLEIHDELQRLREAMQSQFAELQWDKLQRRQPHLADVIRRLTAMGLSRSLVQSIIGALTCGTDQQQVWRNAIGLLAKKIPLSRHDVCDEGGIFALVGPTGTGKTTSIAKLAARFALRHGTHSVGLVTTDGFRIGAQETLLRFGKILGVPVQIAANPQLLSAALEQLADKQLVLIDTAGFGPRDKAMFDHLEQLTQHSPTIQSLLTLAANTQTESLNETIAVFDRLGLDGAIITKLDEATSLGGLLSAVIEAELMVCYVSDGQRVPEDLKTAATYRAGFISQAVTLAKQFARDRFDAPEQETTLLNTEDNRVAVYG